MDSALAINVISSLGGGTGSGLGTKTIEKLSEEFNIDILSHVVLPNMSGETSLQVYNCLLPLSVIHNIQQLFFRFKMKNIFNSTDQKIKITSALIHWIP